MRLKILKKNLIKVLALLLFGCGNTDKSTYEIIDFEKNYETEKMNVGEIVKDFKYIALETTDESVIGRVSKLIPLKSGFLIMDYFNHLTFFDNDGRFVRHIGKKGQGPGEYIQIDDIDVCDKEKNVFLLDEMQRQILEYDIEGKFIRQIKIKSQVSKFLKTTFGFLIYRDPLLQAANYGNPVPSLVALDNDGNETGVLHHRTVNLKNYPPFLHSPLLKKYGNRYFYYPPLQDTIYSASQDGITPEYILFKGVYSIAPEDVADLETRRTAYKKGIELQNFIINDKWLIFRCMREFKVELYLYDLSMKKLKNLSGKNNLPGFLNDIDGSFDVFPEYLYNNSIIETADAAKILEERIIPKELEKLDAEANPILRISSIKK